MMGDPGPCAKCGAVQRFLFLTMTTCPKCDGTVPKTAPVSTDGVQYGDSRNFVHKGEKWRAVFVRAIDVEEFTWALRLGVGEGVDNSLSTFLLDPQAFHDKWWAHRSLPGRDYKCIGSADEGRYWLHFEKIS